MEGVKFSKNGYHFNGSQIDREFSYSKIDFWLSQNIRQEKTQDHNTQQNIPSSTDNSAPLFVNLFGGLFQSHPGNNPDEEKFQRWMQRKKRRKEESAANQL